MKREGGVPVNEILVGDVLARLRDLPDGCVHCAITSPPYWGLRDYGVAGQLGLEATPEEYVDRMVSVFHEVRRVLRADGTLWLNIGDSYAGSGRGRNSDGKHSHKPTDKQASNRGSIDGRLLRPAKPVRNHGLHQSPVNEGVIGTAWVLPPPGLKCKDLVGIPWRLAFALQADGWWLRSDIIWAKPNPMPESVTDRPTKSHEYIFLLANSERYHYDASAIQESATSVEPNGPTNSPFGQGFTRRSQLRANFRRDSSKRAEIPGQRSGQHRENRKDTLPNLTRNKRTVWTINTQPYPEAHFATFPEKLVEPCILAGSPEGGIVLDPFMGSGTVALVALKASRKFIGIEINPKYAAMAERRVQPELAQGRLA